MTLRPALLFSALLAPLLAACTTTLVPPQEAPPTSTAAPGSATATARPGIEPIDLHLRMTPLDSEVVFRKDPYDRSSFPVLAAVEGDYVEGKATVSGSFTRIFRKKSLRIDLPPDARWHDNRRISLNAMATDPSYLREWAAWDLAHDLGMTGPYTRMVRVHLNDAYVGPFMSFDWIEPAMLERRGLGGDGALYHPNDSAYCGAFHSASLSELERCWFDLSRHDEGFGELAQLAAELSETPAADFDAFLERRFDVDSVINWILLNTITSNTDTYNKNYFLYLSRTTGKWVVIPWDYDLSFGRSADPVLPFPQTILNDNFQYFYTPDLGNPSPLKEKTLANPALYERFQARLAHVLGVAQDPRAPDAAWGWFEPDRFRDRLDDWAQIMLPEITHDRYAASTLADFAEHIEALDYYTLARHALLKHQVLGTTVFNTPRWLPYRSYPTVDEPDPEAALQRQRMPLDLSGTVTLAEAGERVVAVDEQFSRPVGVFSLDQARPPVRVRIEAETERPPRHIPPAHTVDECIERTWFIDLKTPQPAVQPQITLEYLEENSLRHEIGTAVDQRRLSLWAYSGQRWQRLATHANPVAKTLTTRALTLRPGETVRLVACSGASATTHER